MSVTRLVGVLIATMAFSASASAEPVIRAMNFGSTFHDFDVATQTAVAIPLQFPAAFASTMDKQQDGTIYGLQNQSLNRYSFLPSGSTFETVATLSREILEISFDSSDRLFGIDEDSNFYQIDAVTGQVGAATPIRFGGNAITSLQGFDIGPDGTHYLVDATYLYTFDAATGIATRAPNQGTTSPIFTSLDSGSDGSLFATMFSSSTPIAEIDPTTGFATALGSNPLGAPYASLVVTAIPEPCLFGVGLLVTGGLTCRRRRRRRVLRNSHFSGD